MHLEPLFLALADAFDGDRLIENVAHEALRENASATFLSEFGEPLPQPVLDVVLRDDAHPSCAMIADTPFLWSPPQTSDDPKYVADSKPKVHVELIGPDGLVASDEVRLGLYGMLSGHEYGLRTHPAEEIFIMLAGEADWKCGTTDYRPLGPGERSYHPSMLPHANRTRNQAFMSIYIWHGDVSTEKYSYLGKTG